jgi:hypothetical protein
MNAVITVFRELIGLFVDDGLLALTILAVVMVAGVFAIVMPDIQLATGAILLCGCLGVLLANVARAAQR